MNERRGAGRLMVIAVLLVTAACGKIPGFKPPPPPPPPPVPGFPAPSMPAAGKSMPKPVNLTFQVSANVNPSASNRPSPVVVRVYLLKGDSAFRAAAYDKLYEDDKAVLGNDVIDKTQRTLRPGEQTPVTVEFNQETRFIGIAAFFREYDNTQWKLIIPAPLTGDGIVTVDKASVSFAAK